MSTKTDIKAKMTVTVCLGGKEFELTEAEARKLKAELDAIFKEPINTVIVEREAYPHWLPFSGPYYQPEPAFPQYPTVTCRAINQETNAFFRPSLAS